MHMYLDMVKLLLQITKDMVITIGLTYAIITAFLVGTCYYINKGKLLATDTDDVIAPVKPKIKWKDIKLKIIKPKPKKIPKTITNLEVLYHDEKLISKPTTIKQLIQRVNVRTLPLLVLEGNDKEMLEQLEKFVTNHIDNMKSKIEQLREKDEPTPQQIKDISFAEGSQSFAEEILNQIQEIHMPVWGLWESNFKDKLEDMYLLTDMSDDDYKKLIALAHSDFKMPEENRDYDLENFIEHGILEINPEKYAIFEQGAVVRIKNTLVIDNEYNGLVYTEEMDRLKDRTALITGVNKDGSFDLDIDINDNKWSIDMITILQNP